MSCIFSRKTHSRVKLICIAVLLFMMETTLVFGRTRMTIFLPHEAEGKTAHAVICRNMPETVGELLLLKKEGLENLQYALSAKQRVSARSFSRTNAFVCGIFILSLYRVIRQMLYKLIDHKPYRREKYVLAYIYDKTHL